MKTIDKIRKENYNYLARDKQCNVLDLALLTFRQELIDMKEGETEHEQYLLMMLEQEVNRLRDTIDAYKKECDRIHWDKIEELKKED